MDSVLESMQETVVKYANVLSQVLKVDIEIVDDKLNRIAGTGMFQNKVNKNISDEGYAYKSVISSGEKMIIDNPGNHSICKDCPKLNKCEELFEISTPIKLNGKVIGVIGFVCFNENQRDHIVNNYDIFIKFLDQIADLIASKAKEELENQRMYVFADLLNNIIDKIEQGVVIVNEKNELIKINLIGAEILKINEVNDIYTLSFISTGNHILNKKEYRVNLNGTSCVLIGEEYTIDLDNQGINRIFIFSDVEWMKKQAISITDARKDICLDEIIGESDEILKLKEGIIKIARHPSTILITGESGTGKELFARAIHKNSNRVENPFVAINCGAIPDSLLESELFGYVRGAFTGADPKGKIGKFELANKGTIFLDEIGDLPLYMQVKLLRVLQERKIVKIGSNKSIDVDVRIIAATNKNLEKMINENTFREDLYYRLNVIPLHIPPLKERKDDIKVLTQYFIQKYSKLFNKKVIKIENIIWKFFEKYSWPGNIRELENTIEFMVNMMDCNNVLKKETLPRKILNTVNTTDCEEQIGVFNLQKIEKNTIEKVLKKYGNSTDGKKNAAEELGIGIATLYRKLEKYDLSK